MSSPENIPTGTGNGGADHENIDRSAAGDVAIAIADHTDKKDMGFLVKCLGIGILIICIGVGAAFVLYGGLFVNASAEVGTKGKKIEFPKKVEEDKPEIETTTLRKEINLRGAAANTGEAGNFTQRIEIHPPILKK
jgi:hypothetical protein